MQNLIPDHSITPGGAVNGYARAARGVVRFLADRWAFIPACWERCTSSSMAFAEGKADALRRLLMVVLSFQSLYGMKELSFTLPDLETLVKRIRTCPPLREEQIRIIFAAYTAAGTQYSGVS